MTEPAFECVDPDCDLCGNWPRPDPATYGTYPDAEEERTKVDARAAAAHPSTNPHHLTWDRLRALITKNTAATLTHEEVTGALNVLDRIFAEVERRKAEHCPDFYARIGLDLVKILEQGYT